MSNTKAKILLIEDDAAISEMLEYNLQKEGYQVVCKFDGNEGITAATADPPNLIILDVMLPGADGYEICRQLRERPETKTLPILMLTAKSEEVDQVVGFTVGADDYVTKPFSHRVLLQRIKVLLTRRGPTEEGNLLQAGPLAIDRMAHEARLNGETLPLTPTEYRLLEALMSQPDRAFSRQDLLRSAIGEDTIVLDRTIDVHIRSLRSKIGAMADSIKTVRGVGYRFDKE